VNRRVVLGAGAVLVGLAAVLATLWVMQPPMIPAATPAGSEFVLAAPASRVEPDAVERALKREIWGLPTAAYSRAAQQQARAAESPVEKWQLTSTYRVGTQSFVLLRRGDKTPEALKAGDLLPDGAKIVEVQESRVWVLADGKRVPRQVPPR
jgi:hypothetical protein